MKQNWKSNAKKEVACYYQSYSVCTSNQSEFCNKRCPGSAECQFYISENDYFTHMMEGKIKEEEPRATQQTLSATARKNLVLGKSKKALKKEAKLEAAKNPQPSGFSLGDDPRFKDLFKGL